MIELTDNYFKILTFILELTLSLTIIVEVFRLGHPIKFLQTILQTCPLMSENQKAPPNWKDEK